MPEPTRHRSADSVSYEIRLEGRLDPRWAARFDGMTLASTDDGSTVLTAATLDQAALHGVLRRVRDLGLPLLSVTQLGPDRPDTAPAHPAPPGRDAP